MYSTTATGLAPEIVHFNQDNKSGGDDIIIKKRDSHNILRPETVESLYYLYWVTQDEVYREQGWEIFSAFEEHCRVSGSGGYTGLEDVTESNPRRRDKMETFFLGETLKYLLMLFSPNNPLPFESYTLNTEAHAFPISETVTGVPPLLSRGPLLREAQGGLPPVLTQA
ncbi:unnamed protein product [Discosporangium mesarthrocarpum]